MMRSKTSKLILSRETLRDLQPARLREVGGGGTVLTSTSCWAGCLVTDTCWGGGTVSNVNLCIRP